MYTYGNIITDTLYSALGLQVTVQCTLYIVQCTLYSVHCTVYNVQCTCRRIHVDTYIYTHI